MVRIVVDSGCDLSAEARQAITGIELISVPLTLTVDGYDYLDDNALDVSAYLKHAESSALGPTTAAPSPHLYLDAYASDGSVFVVTLSSKLSASFESACLAARLRADQFMGALTHVFDSLSSSVGETLIAMKIADLVRNKLTDEDLVTQVEHFITNMNTFFILDNFDTAVRTGRMSRVAATMAEFLHIKPICAGVEGEMKVVGKARNYQKAVKQLIKMMKDRTDDFSERILAISHVEAEQKALATQAEILAEIPFKDSFITSTGGLCSTYASRGGIILAF
ncbi:MAG: DegV family protein [Coriobacteriales bacterium]|jgi:DegV family protein with EDD domain|nr:DegV family protein [Coriobacteriales bacterium]